MNSSPKGLFSAFGFVSISFLTGCISAIGPQRFATSFLPPAPPASYSSSSSYEAPAVAANPYLAASLPLVQPKLRLPPQPSQADPRIRSANDRFAAGKILFAQGNSQGARIEFDAAIDILLGTPESAPDRLKAEARLEQLVAEIYKIDVNRLGAGDFSSQQSYDKAPLEDILDMTFPVDPSTKPKVREQLSATVSQLPLVLNDSVLSYINYFSGDRGKRTIIAGLRRAGKYRPLISRILAEEGVPQELIYLAQAESGFLPRAVSHKAAVGMWQFIQFRGRQYGLHQTAHSDDRLDPEKATRSAARHLRDLYEKFGDWYLAIAGYNCGDGCVDRAVQRTGYADFWEIRNRNAIPRETTNYVPIILAMTIMHKNAKDYGIDNIDAEPPLEYDSLELTSPTHLGLLADAADRPVSDLKDLNPALLSTVAPAGFAVHVPAGKRKQVIAALETIPSERRASWRIHRVGDGETIESIAKRYSVPAGAITAANSTSDAEAGDVLAIPTASQVERSRSRSAVHRAPGKATAIRTKAPARSKLRASGASKNSKRAAARPVRRNAAHRGTQAASLR